MKTRTLDAVLRAMPARQVHLDFHTSEHLPGIGAAFDRREWQRALRTGAVNSITVFAKCHHSWSYYPTRIGRRHPNLRGDLLGDQIRACHDIGVRAPVYFTVGWSANDVERHPEWGVLDRNGRPVGANFDPDARPDDPRPAVSWRHLFPARGYRDLILAQTREICERCEVDGFFYDICFGPPDYSAASRADMQALGLDPEREEDALAYRRRVWTELMEACNSIIHQAHPAATIFYNGAADPGRPEWQSGVTHFELEDLPTTWGGYDKLPLRAKYYSGLGRTYVAMSGKFHTMWGEFGGYKHPDALRYEVAAMMAFGARCSIGDQLHPNGRMDPATYRNIGAAYRYARKIERHGPGARHHATLGLVLTGGKPVPGGQGAPSPDQDQGVVKMLLESQTDFEIAGADGDWSRFETVVLTGGDLPDPGLRNRVADYRRNGGNILALYRSALDPESGRFLFEDLAEYLGPANRLEDYTLAGPALSRGLVDSPFLNYAAALRVRPAPGSRVLAKVREPYFDRTYARYCSHQNTPYRPDDAPHPAAVQRGRTIYLAHPLGALYANHGARVHRDFFLHALRRLHKRPALEVRLPSAGRANLLHQPDRRRYVAHLLYGPPLPRGRCQVIEDLVPLRDIAVRLRVPERIRCARLVPDGRRLPVRREADGAVSVTVREFRMHVAVEWSYR